MRLIYFYLWLISLFFLSAATVQAKNEVQLSSDPALIQGKLNNGMRYLIYPHANPPGQVNLWLQVHAGSLQEQDDQRGVAHFVEHMLFNGSRDYPGNQVISTFESLGLKFGKDVNAYTTYDETVYQVNMPSGDTAALRIVMNIFRNWAAFASFDPAEVEAERGVITEEWRAAQGIKWRINQARRPFSLAGSPYLTREPIGLMDTVANVSPQRLRDYYQRWYQPANMTFIILGDIDAAQAGRLITDAFATLPSLPTSAFGPLPVTEAQPYTRMNLIRDPEIALNSVALIYRIPQIRVRDEQSFIAQSHLTLLSQLFNQRLQERVQRGDLATALGGMSRTSTLTWDYQSVMLRMNARADRLSEAAQALLQELARIDRDGFSQAELDHLRETHLALLQQAAAQSAERDGNMLTARIANHERLQTPLISPQERYALTQRLWPTITPQTLHVAWRSLRATADKTWEQTLTSQARALSPQELLEMERAATIRVPAPYVTTLRQATLPPVNVTPGQVEATQKIADGIVEARLSNGARLILAQPDSRDEQRVQISALVNRGYLNFAPPQTGLVALANKAVNGSGVAGLSATELKRWSAQQATQFTSSVRAHHTLLNVSTTVPHLAAGFQLMHQRLRAGQINTQTWQTLQQAQGEALMRYNQRPRDKFNHSLYQARYQDARTTMLTPEQLANTDAQAALALDRRLFSNPVDMTFIVVGRVDQHQALPLVERYLATLRREETADVGPGNALVQAKEDRQITLHEDSEPVAQLVDYRNYTVRTPLDVRRHLALQAMNFALSRDLRLGIREQASGAYSVSSRFQGDALRGRLNHRLAFTCQPQRYRELQAQAQAITSQRLAVGINRTELEEYRRIALRELALQASSTARLSRALINSQLFGADSRLYTHAASLLQALDATEVNHLVSQTLAVPGVKISGVLLPRSASGTLHVSSAP